MSAHKINLLGRFIMDKKVRGKIIKGVGGLYTVLVAADGGELAGLNVRSRARGSLRHTGNQPLAGQMHIVHHSR